MRARVQRRSASREAFLTQLLLIVPFYSIEAWLFQHTAGGKRFCLENAACKGKHVGRFTDWEQDRGLLDEVPQIKQEVCFKDKHNRQLAEGLDVDPVYYAEKSLFATISALQGCAALLRALAATRPS